MRLFKVETEKHTDSTQLKLHFVNRNKVTITLDIALANSAYNDDIISWFNALQNLQDYVELFISKLDNDSSL